MYQPTHGDMGVVNEDDILIAISKSGNTEELIHFLEQVQHKNCKIISQKNKGSANATNVGIHASGMKYIKFLDADDLIINARNVVFK